MVFHNGNDTKNNAVKIAVGTAEIFIYSESILTGTISVRDKNGTALWQKINCTADDIPFAIEVAKRGIQTNVFES